MKVSIFMGHFAQGGGYGGGERHSAEFAYSLSKYYDVQILVESRVDVEASLKNFKEGYGIDLSNIPIHPLDMARIQSSDIYININHGWLIPPVAKRNIIVVFYPQYPWNTMGYDTIIANSSFVKGAIKQQWGRDDAVVIYPPIDISGFQSLEKKSSIVTVGRFFEVPDGNNKNHELMIKCFKKLPEDFEFHIVGTIQNEQYYKKVRRLAEDCPRIYFHHDIALGEMSRLYGEAKFYWHATGYGGEKVLLPSSMEHFGMSICEAMASGCIPIVFHGGAADEIGIPTWEKPEELIFTTKKLSNNQELYEKTKDFCLEKSKEFSKEEAEKQLIDIIESPIVIYPLSFQRENTPIVEVGDSYKREKAKVCWIGDSPVLTSGFGLVAKMICNGLLEGGHQVACLGMNDVGKSPHANVPYPIWRTTPDDVEGFNQLRDFLTEEKPDNIIINYDPGKIVHWLGALKQIGSNIPVIAYFPTEGWPLAEAFVEMTQIVAKPITYLKWASDYFKEIADVDVEWIPHGADHAPFCRFSNEKKEELKRQVGWGGKFVVEFMGRNKRTKQHPLLIIALRKLKEKGINDVRLYLHCLPFEGYMMHGWDLREIARLYGVEDWVRFPNMESQWHGIDYAKPGPIDEQILKEYNESNPQSVFKAWQAIFDSYSLIERYNMADLFISPSQVEGFGLPVLEAMACGVPVAVPKDGGAQEEVVGDAGILIPPASWDTWFTGALLASISVDDIVDIILRLKDSPEYREQLAIKGMQRAQQYKWKTAQERFCEIVRGI